MTSPAENERFYRKKSERRAAGREGRYGGKKKKGGGKAASKRERERERVGDVNVRSFQALEVEKEEN